MAGYVNSWIDQYDNRPAPCIYDTVNQSSVPGLGPIGNCWMWLVIGAVAAALLSAKKRA